MISGIFFEAGGRPKPSAGDWANFYAALEDTFARHLIEPGYYIADNLLHRAKFKRFGDHAHGVRIARGFEDIEILTLAATPPGMNEPGFNWNALCTVTYVEGYDRLSLELMIDQSHLPFAGSSFESSLEALAALSSWDFGWAMQRAKVDGIEQYLSGSGLGDGLTPKDRRRIELWYNCYSPQERQVKVRDVFAYNIIGSGHLANTLRDGRSLKAFIESDKNSELRSINTELWLWKVSTSHTEEVGDMLRGMGVLASE